MKGKAARAKGHGWERTVCQLLKFIYPEAKRHLEMQFQEAKGFDLDCVGPFRIQCKKTKQHVTTKKIEEIKETTNVIPVLIAKADHKKATITFYLDDILDLTKQLITNPYEALRKLEIDLNSAKELIDKE